MEVVSPLVGQEVRGLEGLHLYHYALSNCSQKVRMVLAEKGLGWANHHLDLAKAEHRTDAYRRVHPNGVVPALVDDGTIVIESSDIMEYIDERFPNPPLRPAGENDLVQMRLWVARQDSIQRPLVILSDEFVFKAIGAKNGGAPSRATIAGAIRTANGALAELNRHMCDRTWLAGNALSLADIAWVVDVHRFALMHFPTFMYPNLRGWYRRMRKLTSFRQAVLAYEPSGFRRRIDLYTMRRWLTGSHVGSPRWRKPQFMADA
jgi:glutathione S-transferase